MTTASRRALFKGAAAATVAVGWSQASGWVTAAEAAPAGMVPVPALDGTLETAPAVLARFSHDFGELVRGTPRAVLRPGSVADVVRIIRYARRAGLKVAMNGQSGTGADLESHSNYGQAAVPGGISIDARSLSTIHSIGAGSAVVDAGVTWAQLADAALARGLTPPALTDYLNLSIGGTISVGGVGGTVQKYGLLVDTVQEVDVVTGAGDLVTASATVRPDLFNTVLAGGGQVGVIVRATVKLVPAQARALNLNLYYNDLATYTADAEKVMRDGRFDHQEGGIVPTADGTGWRYKIEAVVYYNPPGTPDQGRLLAGLRHDRASLEVQDTTYREWIFRADAWEAFLKEYGYWQQAKPWLSMVLPTSAVPAFTAAVVAELTAADLGGGFTGLYPFPTRKLTRPMFALPATGEPVTYLFDLLRFPGPEQTGDIDRMLRQNRRLYDLGVSLGGKRYLVGAVPNMTGADWRRHFGPHWATLRAAKLRFDPDGILTPGQGFFS
ncbi:FAD-binding protein [Dactylosporangium sp. NPDC048998]|uniref:FAD-binding protein n=1 Tax=Dactylosporangium sp. NPDC048998 TaxID=3363976 RepID=UPI0037122610